MFCALHDQLASLGRHAQLTRCFSAVAELLVTIVSLVKKLLDILVGLVIFLMDSECSRRRASKTHILPTTCLVSENFN